MPPLSHSFSHYTHCGAERHPHAWIDGATGEHGRCWMVDDEGVWSSHTGSPRTEDGEHVASSVAIMGWYGKKASGHTLDGIGLLDGPNE